jgi:competence protein ComEC
VARLTYAGTSILFCGDTVGRHIDDPDDSCIAAEMEMVANAPNVSLASEVIVAPHHGADNGSSKDFVRAVDPSFVIFSAGHEYRHPRASAARRYLDAGVPPDHIFRTDWGDNEGGDEWDDGSAQEDKDKPGDDDVDVLIQPDGEIVVEYRETHQ